MRRTAVVIAVVLAFATGLEVNGLAVGANSLAHKLSGSSLKSNSVTGKQIKESTLGIVPRATTAVRAAEAASLPALVWHPITTFENNWGNYPVGARNVAYAVDAQGIVHFKGTLACSSTAGVGQPAFTLPATVAPTQTQEYFAVVVGGGSLSAVEINTDGEVEPLQSPVASLNEVAGFVSLEGITFSSK